MAEDRQNPKSFIADFLFPPSSHKGHPNGRFVPAPGAAVAIAGGDKLAGYSYDRMFRHLGWSPAAERAAACAETAGGLLMMPPATRRFGGMLVATVSAALLLSEVNHRDAKLALPRALVLLGGLAALFVPARRAR